MKKVRIVILLLLLAAVGLLALFNPRTLQDWVYVTVGKPVVNYLFTRAEEQYKQKYGEALDERITPRELYRRVKHGNQLKPDLRFVEAAEQLYAFVYATDAVSAELTASDRSWEVRIDGSQAGSLPFFPSFGEGLAWLETWAVRLIDETGFALPAATSDSDLIEAGRDGYNPSALIDNLQRLDQRWNSGERSGQTLHAVVNNLTHLSLINGDTIGLGDDHNARTLAMLALARVVNPAVDYRQQRSKLAYALGYLGDSRRLLAETADGSAWRDFIEEDNLGLIERLSGGGAVNEARYLMLRRLAQLGATQKWLDFLYRFYGRERIPVHALMTGYELDRSQVFYYVSHAVPLVMVELAGGETAWQKLARQVLPHVPRVRGEIGRTMDELLAEMLRPGLGWSFNEFNRILEAGRGRYVGPFIGGDAWVGLQRSFFIGAIYKHGVYTLDRMESARATAHLVNQLQAVDADEARLLAAYFDFLVRARGNQVSIAEALPLIEALEVYGGEPMYRVFEQIRDGFDYGSARVATLMASIVNASDSRVEGRFGYAYNVQRYLFDPGKAHLAYRAIIRDEAANSQSARAWVAYYYDDMAAMIDVLNDPKTTFETADHVVENIEDRRLSNAQLDRIYRLMLDKYAWNWHLRRHYIDALERKQRFADGRAQAIDWLQNHSEYAHRYDLLRAQVYVGRSYRLEGKLDQAQAAIENTLIDDYGFGFYEATRIALARGDTARAVEIAETMRGRYPNSRYSLRNLVRAYWANGDHESAAKLLDAAPARGFYAWRNVFGEIFSDVFAADVAGGTAAFEALANTGIDHIRIVEIAKRANRNGLHELAFKSSGLLTADGPGIFVYKLYAYAALEQWQGTQAALAWLDEQFPSQDRNWYAPIIYYQGRYDLLWEFISEPGKGSHPQGIWTIRAAASVIDPETKPGYRRRLADYYASRDGNEYYDRLGRMALGLDSGEAMLNTTYAAKGLAETAYYKAIQEYARGDYYAAADWMRVAVETRYRINSEYRWAYGQLETWAIGGIELSLQIAQSRSREQPLEASSRSTTNALAQPL